MTVYFGLKKGTVGKVMRSLFVLAMACQGKIATIELSESAEATIEGQSTLGGLTDLVGALGFEGFTDMDISQSQDLVNQGVEPGDIETAVVTSFRLAVLEPTDGDLSFISSLEIWVEAPDLEPVLVASQTDFPVGSSEILFNLEDVELVDYVVSDSMRITTEATGSVPSETTKIEASATFEIGVTAQGACNALSQE